jgi:hypothetical protein
MIARACSQLDFSGVSPVHLAATMFRVFTDRELRRPHLRRCDGVKHKAFRVVALPNLVALATILIAAGIDLESNRIRLKALPIEQRKKLADNLLRLDAVLTPEQQAAARLLDRKINELPAAQQMEYFAALRRYHNWLVRLPDDRREEILRTSAAERMAAISKLAGQPRYKIAGDLTPQLLQVGEIGEHSPFELAAIYKIWQALTPVQRKEVEKPVNNAVRLQVLFRLGEAKGLPREVLPAGYDEETALSELGTYLKKGRSALVIDLPKKQGEARLTEIARRQAINLFNLSPEQKAAIKYVASERLDQFAATFPWWLQSAFDSYPPDEARRRLTIIYRLVFPHPSEIKPMPRESPAPSGTRAVPSHAKKAGESPPATPGTRSEAPL